MNSWATVLQPLNLKEEYSLTKAPLDIFLSNIVNFINGFMTQLGNYHDPNLGCE